MDFTISTNCFTGRLPESGLREVTAIYIHYNVFAGTVAESLPRSYSGASLDKLTRYQELCPPSSSIPAGRCQQG
eukprot:2803849-Amphidinium_carterae.1